jgi:hypothetical protein
MSQGDAVATVQAAGFGVAVLQERCQRGTSGCRPGAGIVWKERPVPGTQLRLGSTVTLSANP